MRQTKKQLTTINPTNTHLIPVMKKMYDKFVDFDIRKKVNINVSFYFEDTEDSSAEIPDVFDFLKDQKFIINYSFEIGSKTFTQESEEADDGTIIPYFEETLNFIKYKCELIPEKITEYLIEQSVLPKYFVRLDERNGEYTLILNKKYILAHPRYGNPAHDLLDVFYNNQRQKLTRLFVERTIEKKNKTEYKFKRRLAGILADLGFKKQIGKIFFPHTSQEAIYFRNDVFLNEIGEEKINHKALERQLKELRHL